MHIYHIVEVYDAETTLDLTIVDDKPSRRNISLNKSRRVSQFQVGRDIIVLRDAYLDMEDIAYICDNRLYLNQRPYPIEQYGCECLIKYVAGLENENSPDCDILEIAIALECAINKIPLSEKPNINLLNLITKVKGY